MAVPRIDGLASGLVKQTEGMTRPVNVSPGRSDSSFADLVADQLRGLNLQHQSADHAVEQLATGKTDDIQNVVLSMAQADLTFRMALEIRNRLIESYQEIMRMQI